VYYHLAFQASELTADVMTRVRVIAAGLLLTPATLRAPEHSVARSRLLVRETNGGHQARSVDDPRLEVWAPSPDEARDVLFALLMALKRVETPEVPRALPTEPTLRGYGEPSVAFGPPSSPLLVGKKKVAGRR
jgi:hypothetical protein